MKFLFCTNHLSGFTCFRYDIVKHFNELGHEVILVYPSCTEVESYYNKLKVICQVVPLDFDPNSKNPLEDLRFLKRLFQIYRRERPDIVFNYTIKPNIYSSIAAKCFGIKVVSMMAGLGYVFEGNSIAKKIARLLYKVGLSCSDKVFVLNQNNYDRVVDRLVPEKKLILLRGGEGVNMEEYPYKPNGFDSTRFLMVARLLYDKGYKEFVEAAKIVKKEYPQVHFELLGWLSEDSPKGVKKTTLDADVASGAVEYLGVTTDVPSIVLRDGVVVVVASFYMEGMNRALMEACSMGRPIITTNMPGCREMVEHGKTGFIVEPRNSQSLADACLAFLKMTKSEKEMMARASFEKCQRQFDVKDVIKEYDRIVAELSSKCS